MEDFNFWWYLIAAVIYFLTRSKKKKNQPQKNRPGTENNPTEPPKSFEDLLKEITGENQPEPQPVEQTPIEIIEEKPLSRELEEKQFEKEGERRVFADEESRRVYEDSIKQAEGFDIEFKPDEHFKEPSLFKQGKEMVEEEEYSIADEIRDGLTSNEARKAVIYSEILNRRY